jgi:hypothetical protein
MAYPINKKGMTFIVISTIPNKFKSKVGVIGLSMMMTKPNNSETVRHKEVKNDKRSSRLPRSGPAVFFLRENEKKKKKEHRKK